MLYPAAGGGTVVQLYLEPKGTTRTSLVVQHTRLPNAAAVEEHRAQWKQTFTALTAHLARR